MDATHLASLTELQNTATALTAETVTVTVVGTPAPAATVEVNVHSKDGTCAGLFNNPCDLYDILVSTFVAGLAFLLVWWSWRAYRKYKERANPIPGHA
ncbi:hypothetical protein MKEN_01109300 [Mycena kentingensis (nom. inval.)]|nr:hypothetical protein MKEN_01109300 [Mycena kentingensis (nom. inval.)]